MVGQRIHEKLGKLPMQFRERGFWRDFDSILPDGTGLSPATIENAVHLTRKENNRCLRSVIILGQANKKQRSNIGGANVSLFLKPLQVIVTFVEIYIIPSSC